LPTSQLCKFKNKKLIERDQISKIENLLSENKKIILINSPESNGLSIVVHLIAERFTINVNQFVYCLNSNEDTIEFSFKQFANKFPKFVIEDNYSQEQIILKVYDRLNNIDKKTKIMFIFNDCENYESIQNYIKPHENIYFLIATRNKYFINKKNKSLFEKFDLNPFNQNECLDYLKNAQIEINLKANRIQPYVLNKIIAFVKLKSLHKMEFNESDLTNNAYRDKELFEILIEKYNSAWNILKFSSILDSNFISISILEILTDYNKNDLKQIIHYIETISLINALYNDEIGFQISSTFQQDIIEYLKDDNLKELENMRKKIADSINQIFDSWSKNKYYYNSLIKITNFLLDEKTTTESERYEIMKNLAEFYYVWSNYDESLEFYKECLEISSKQSSFEMAFILNKLGLVYEMKEDFTESLANHHKSIDIYEKITKNNSTIQYLTALNNTANVYKKMGEYDKALEYFEKSENQTKKIFKFNDPLIASSLTNIGCVYNSLNMNDLAIESFNKAIEIFRQAFSTKDSIEIANLFKNLAKTYLNKQEYDLALRNYEECLIILEKLFNKNNNTQLADVFKEMAFIYQKKGDENKALEFYKKALLIFKKFYGDETSIADSLSSIAEIYQAQNNHDKALDYYNQSLKANQDVLKNNNNDQENIVNIYIKMGIVYKSKGKYKLSLECFNNALCIAYTHKFDDKMLISSIHDNIDSVKIYNGNHGKYRKIPSDIINGGSGAHVCLVEDINDNKK
jgi:tetratricopeptide (TPR) repeat protein